MLAGRVPFDADNHTDLALQHLRDEPPPLTALNPAVPIQIEQIVNKAMSKEPASRYRTADLFGRALLDYRRMTNQATGYQRPVAVPASTGSTTVAATAARPQEVTPAQGGTDWLGWILGTLAFVAVVGLIPLFVLVWRAYSQPASPATVPSSPNSIATPGERHDDHAGVWQRSAGAQFDRAHASRRREIGDFQRTASGDRGGAI